MKESISALLSSDATLVMHDDILHLIVALRPDDPPVDSSSRWDGIGTYGYHFMSTRKNS